MNRLDTWCACLADSEKGVSFFDLRPFSDESLRIEADPITEPRWDRVLPILEEEQVFMCRMMAPLLQKGRSIRVLDIGTGSGVFAICAAKLGCCVTAIDISPRALRFAQHNARINGIPVTDPEKAPASGEIQLRQIDFRDLETTESFDVVILAPPYNPTCEGFLPALHASAGPLGQTCFEEQLPVAARLLRPGGFCIGNQMLLSDESGSLHSSSLVAESFPAGAFEYTRIIKNDISVRSFLSAQYSTYLKKELGTTPSSAEVSTYIDSFSSDLHFALIYYEAQKSAKESNDLEPSACRFIEVELTANPPQLWADRELLHRRIIDHTAQENSFPAPALFLELDALPDFPKAHCNPSESTSAWKVSCLGYIDSWIGKTGLLDPEDGLFDLILVDTAPWYPSRAKRASLPQECAAWMNKRFRGGHAGKSLLETARSLLLAYQENTIRQQKCHVGPFLHPVFTGSKLSCEWRPVHFSTLGGIPTRQQTIENPSFERARNLAEKVANCILSKKDYESLAESAKNFSTGQSQSRDVEFVYIRSNLEKLEVPAGDLALYNKSLDDRIASISGTGSDHEELLRDFDDCHLSMHLRVRRLSESSQSIGSERVSYLIGLPVSIASAQSSHEIRTLPESYRGGVWLYLESSSWSPAHERYILDVVRILSMLYEDQYAKMSSTELRLIGADASRFNWSHETKHLIVALRRWRIQVSDLSEDEFPERGPLLSRFGSECAILPFAKLHDAGMAHLQAWTMATSASDLPFWSEGIGGSLCTIEELARLSFASAKDAFLGRLLRRYPLNEGTIKSLESYFHEVGRAMPKLRFSGTYNPKIELDTEFWQDFARLFLCEFREMFQHSLWSKGCDVLFSAKGTQIESIEFHNYIAGDLWDSNVEGLKLPAVEHFRLKDVVKAFKDPLKFSPGLRGDGDGDRVREGLAENLNARVHFPDSKNGEFRVAYSFGDF